MALPTACQTANLCLSLSLLGMTDTTVTFDDTNDSKQMHLYQEDYRFISEDEAGGLCYCIWSNAQLPCCLPFEPSVDNRLCSNQLQ